MQTARVPSTLSRSFLVPLAIATVMLSGCGDRKEAEAPVQPEPDPDPEPPALTANERFDAVVKVEKVIAELTTLVSRLGPSAKNLLVPDAKVAGLFSEEVEVLDVGVGRDVTPAASSLPVIGREWPVAESATPLAKQGFITFL